MGLGRFANFITKSIYNDIEEININNNIKKIISNYIIFDINFLIYQGYIDIENEINDINKILLCKERQFDKYIINVLDKMINILLKQSHWNIISPYNITNYKDFIDYINTKIDDILILDIVIFNKILNLIFKNIYGTHHIQYIQSICIFFDGVPSLSKMIEQRRRRIKKYIESDIKNNMYDAYLSNLTLDNVKLYEVLTNKYIFDNVELNNSLTFDYTILVANKFNIEKNIYPSSIFIINFEKFIKTSLIINNVNIIINSSCCNGEADLKIFKYIAEENINGEYCIHTIDSDLIHQILVQQVYYDLNNKNIKLSVCKYTNNYINTEYIQIFNADLIIKHILDLYNLCNNIITDNIKIIWDLCFIFYLFGNDHIPEFMEIGPELGMEYFLQSHYSTLKNTNIIDYTKTIHIDLNKLSLYLTKIYSTNRYNITKIILQKYFKINYQLITLFIEKFNYIYTDILIFLKKYIIYKGLKLSVEEYNNLYDDDLRKVLINNFIEGNLNDYNNIDIFNLNDENKKLFLSYDKLIEENINYYEYKYNGLILYKKSLYITHNCYNDICNFINIKSNYLLNIKYPQYRDKYSIDDYITYLEKISIQNYKQIFDKNISNNYLKNMVHLLYMQFDNMTNYHSDNLTYYKYIKPPSLLELLVFLSDVKKKQINIWLNEIKNNNIYNKYINSDNHYKLITPYLDNNEIINNIDFNYRDINIVDFFNKN